jgi:hypothetical protein
MTERRSAGRPDSLDRRDFPRPPLWLNLLLLVIGVALAAVATTQRHELNRQMRVHSVEAAQAPPQVNQIKSQLLQLNLTEQELKTALDQRLKILSQLNSDQFYLAIDTSRGVCDFHYGADIIRSMHVETGAPRTIEAAGRSYSFPALKGAFAVVGKEEDAEWRVPPWVFAVNGEPPQDRMVRNGLGRLVIELPNDYVIHAPPPPDSPLKGAKPGSFMIDEENLRAIWPRVSPGTMVYIY